MHPASTAGKILWTNVLNVLLILYYKCIQCSGNCTKTTVFQLIHELNFVNTSWEKKKWLSICHSINTTSPVSIRLIQFYKRISWKIKLMQQRNLLKTVLICNSQSQLWAFRMYYKQKRQVHNFHHRIFKRQQCDFVRLAWRTPRVEWQLQLWHHDF